MTSIARWRKRDPDSFLTTALHKLLTFITNWYPDVTFTIQMTRRSLFYVVNLIFPCLLIYAVSFLGFFLPTESGDKVNLEEMSSRVEVTGSTWRLKTNFAFKGQPRETRPTSMSRSQPRDHDVHFEVTRLRSRFLGHEIKVEVKGQWRGQLRRQEVNYEVTRSTSRSNINVQVKGQFPSQKSSWRSRGQPRGHTSGSKVNLEITVLLALVVFLLIAGETLPPTPDAIPALGT